MRNLLTILAFIFTFNCLTAQVQVELTIENQMVSGTDFIFDIYLKTTPGSSGNLYLGTADFVLTFNSQHFTSPTIASTSSLDFGGCTFVPTNQSGSNTDFTRDAYFNRTAPSINGNVIRLNHADPAPGTQNTFNNRIAVIDGTSSTYRFGRFILSGISNPSGTAGLTWKISGTGVNTQVFTLATTTPWTSSPTNIVAINPFDAPLPVVLNTFLATANEKDISLNWQSESEDNLSEYELQRSTNGTNFSKINWQKAMGGSFQQDYRFEDIDVLPGVIYYYRLKMVDNDGSFTYSPVRSAKIDGIAPSDLSISPNPAKGHTVIQFNSFQEGNNTLELFNEKGALVFQKHYALNEGENKIMLNTGRFPGGNYFIKINIGEEILSDKLVIANQ